MPSATVPSAVVPVAPRRRSRTPRRFAFPLVGAAMLVPGCAPSCAPAGPATSVTTAVADVIDGDTIQVALPGGGTERVRLVGIDAPESDVCGGATAAAHLGALLPTGTPITLTADGRDDRDRYGRLLRYVDAGAIDAGRSMIGDGLANARFDSRDGYGRHAREADYVALDAATPDRSCDAQPAVGTPAAGFANCTAVRAAGRAPIRAGEPGWDPKFDADGDGIGCE